MRTDPILQFMAERKSEMLETLQQFVEQESPSSDKALVDRMGELVAHHAERLGARIIRHKATEYGDHLQADFEFPECERGSFGRVLLLGHIDTVWETGTLQRMPFRVKDGRAYGPGIFDMKAGIVQGLAAITALREMRIPVCKHVTLFLVTDEEVGSNSSRAITEKLARDCNAVLVLEPSAGPKGALKTARKGVGEYRLEVRGRAAHSGLDFTKGASAIVELSRQIARVSAFTRLNRGITVNPGIIGGGTRDNVVAEHAWADIDVRVARLADYGYIKKQFSSLKPFDKRTKVEVSGGLNRPPMERTPETIALFAKARKLGAHLGMSLKEIAVGGGSDGNLTSALGVPTLDGLGAVGDGAHAAHEHIIVEQLPKRAALLAHLITNI